MYRGKRVGVVVPAYNEADHVGEVIDTMPPFVDRVYAIDDRSTDDTWAVITRHAERANAAWDRRYGDEAEDPVLASESESAADLPREGDGGAVTAAGAERQEARGAESSAPDGGADVGRRVVPLRNGANRGVGGTIKHGYRRALADGVDVVAVMNGDGQMDPDLLPSVLDPVVEGRTDYAKGNRLCRQDHREGMSRLRFAGNAILTALTKVSSGYWKLLDPQNGYTAISRDALATIDLDRLYEGYGFLNDVLVELNVNGLRVTDVDVPAVYGDEQSHIRLRSFVPKLSWLLLTSFLWRLRTRYVVRDFHPLVLFYVLAGIGAVAGLGHGVWALTGAGDPLVHAGLAVTDLLLSGTTLAVAMVLDMHANSTLEDHDHGAAHHGVSTPDGSE